MNEIIRKDILSVLKNSLKAIKKEDSIELRSQSDKTIHNSSTFQDKYSITTAVVIYSIYKLFDKNKVREYPGWKSFEKFLILELKKSVNYVSKNRSEQYLESLRRIVRSMTKLDKGVGLFVDHVIHVTKIKKATKLHEHGLSTSRVAELLGIQKWEVMSYLGHTKTFDTSLNRSKSVKDRLNLTSKIFSIK